jgi:CheY-like chemotaxis protein
MSELWIEPGTHAVRFYDSAPGIYDSVADFFTAGADADDPLVLVGRRSTFKAVTALLASGRYGLTDAADRIRFVDAEAVLAEVMPGGVLDAARSAALFPQMIADIRRDHAGGTIRFYGETVDVLCERGRVDVALEFERFSGRLFELEPRLLILCGYARARFRGGAGATDKSAVCGMHTHVAEGTGDPPAQGDEPPHTAGDPPAPFVYVIDDDTSIRRSLGRFLKLSQWQVRTFDSGEAFLAELDSLTFGCLVIDIQLGGMSGHDLLAHMRTARPTWPAIAMSGSDNDSAEKEALRLGARTFLRKPFDARNLLDAVALALA